MARNENPNANNRDVRPVARECTYQDFMKCQPLNFKGMEGVVGLIRWFKKLGNLVLYQQLSKDITSQESSLKLIAKVYCPRNEIQKMMEFELLQDVVRIANNLMDQKLKGYVVKNAENKRRLEVNQRDNCGQTVTIEKIIVRSGKLHHEGLALEDVGEGVKQGWVALTRDYNGHIFHYLYLEGKQAWNKNGVCEARGKAYVLVEEIANPDSNVLGYGTFPEVFPEDLPWITAYVQVEFQSNWSLDSLRSRSFSSEGPFGLTNVPSVSWIDDSEEEFEGILVDYAKIEVNQGLGYPRLVKIRQFLRSCRLLPNDLSTDQKELNMRRRRWLELLSDYDCEIRYHPGKANVVSDALIRKEWNKPLRVRALV
ncbi:hypothetical protein Tco_0363570 [Tanacetum coccineum]